uniref:Uncharacterized protein n=2 Tax=Tetraselmis sp. GSL018 TaxID=582737 RepID=A0A061SH96_9CHLO
MGSRPLATPSSTCRMRTQAVRNKKIPRRRFHCISLHNISSSAIVSSANQATLLFLGGFYGMKTLQRRWLETESQPFTGSDSKAAPELSQGNVSSTAGKNLRSGSSMGMGI